MSKPRADRLDRTGQPQGRGIAATALELLRQSPGGIRFAELLELLSAEFPEAARPNLARRICDLPRRGCVVRPEPGLYLFNRDSKLAQDRPRDRTRESSFYRGFAAFLGEAEECTRVAPLGGFSLGERWGTPDAVGRVSAPPGALAPWGDLLVCGELKTGREDGMRGFGQAAPTSFSRTRATSPCPAT